MENQQCDLNLHPSIALNYAIGFRAVPGGRGFTEAQADDGGGDLSVCYISISQFAMIEFTSMGTFEI